MKQALYAALKRATHKFRQRRASDQPGGDDQVWSDLVWFVRQGHVQPELALTFASVFESGLELLVLPPPPPQSWDYRAVPSSLTGDRCGIPNTDKARTHHHRLL